jgi:uncharacterized membrane protein (UPF0127 family)
MNKIFRIVCQRPGLWLGVLFAAGAVVQPVSAAQESIRPGKPATTNSVAAQEKSDTQTEKAQTEPARPNRLKLLVGNKPLYAELAATPAQQQKGLMYRTKMELDEGMLFVFPAPRYATVWMKDTILSLSCAFIDSQGRILEIRDLNSTDETIVKSRFPHVRFMLETHRGWFSDNEIAVGAVVRTERGTLAQAFGLR